MLYPKVGRAHIILGTAGIIKGVLLHLMSVVNTSKPHSTGPSTGELLHKC